MDKLIAEIAKREAQIMKFASLGALGVAGGSMVAWVGFVLLIRPVSSGGMDQRGWIAGSAAAFAVLALAAVAHLWFGLQLKKGRESITG